MESNKVKYPVYRQLPNGKSMFKITSDKHFIEIQEMGKKTFVHHITAKTFPDIQLIHDMINFHNNYWLELTSAEFEDKWNAYQQSIV